MYLSLSGCLSSNIPTHMPLQISKLTVINPPSSALPSPPALQLQHPCSANQHEAAGGVKHLHTSVEHRGGAQSQHINLNSMGQLNTANLLSAALQGRATQGARLFAYNTKLMMMAHMHKQRTRSLPTCASSLSCCCALRSPAPSAYTRTAAPHNLASCTKPTTPAHTHLCQ